MGFAVGSKWGAAVMLGIKTVSKNDFTRAETIGHAPGDRKIVKPHGDVVKEMNKCSCWGNWE
jgi:hypothetical protein